MPPKAILFDFDGVIAETENHHVVAWQRTLSFMGLMVPDEVAVRAAEVDDREFLAELFVAREIPVDKVDEWVDRKQELTVQLLRYAPRIYPGFVDLVRALRGKRDWRWSPAPGARTSTRSSTSRAWPTPST